MVILEKRNIEHRLTNLDNHFELMNKSLSKKKEAFVEMIKESPKMVTAQEDAVACLHKIIDDFNPAYAVNYGWNVSSPPTIDEKLKSLEIKK